ncbi:MAG: manganese efflux pump MntP family protein [Sphaerochaetaceae bacterium]|jgi:putative Mn2+ efflux pump MntP|nr:manganese efflux pump MntP family protein [Sphaerochaetaceae bacterium]
MSASEFLTVFGIAIGLSMDAFAVAVTQGACLDIRTPRYPLAIGITFGFFQAAMPLIGWIAGMSFKRIIARMDHWIALVLLALIGLKMFVDGLTQYLEKRKLTEEGASCPVPCGGRLRMRDLLGLAVATSIDALAVGITFGMLQINIWLSILVIGTITFILSCGGVVLGKRTGFLFGDKMQMIGGCVLTALGLKIFIEHLVLGI